MKDINLIIAVQKWDWGISFEGQIPWRSKVDLQHFKEITSTAAPDKYNAVIAGRKTYDSIGRPLPGRINYVITRDRGLKSTKVTYINSLEEALKQASNNELIDKLFIIGGAEIYHQTLRDFPHLIDTTYLTKVDTILKCDTFLDKQLFLNNHYKPVKGAVIDDEVRVTFYTLKGINKGEEEYLNLIRRILESGEQRQNRTGIDTISLFGERMVFDITHRIPFLTTKRLAWKTMLRELLWFISGDTNNATLQAKNVHIWDGNSSREYFDSIGLTDRSEGDLGPVYGFQWRHFGAEYNDCHTDYSNQGVDQLKNVVEQIQNDPGSRRIILTAWNPQAQPLMALPACHLMAQWYVRGEYLDCQLYQRSGDVALGVPFNIASYAVLTYALAHICKLIPGRLIHILGDAHIYVNHIDAVKIQLNRTPHQFPTLHFAREINDIDDFREEDFIISNYKFHPSIKMDMVV